MQWGADLSDREFPVSSLILVEWTIWIVGLHGHLIEVQ